MSAVLSQPDIGQFLPKEEVEKKSSDPKGNQDAFKALKTLCDDIDKEVNDSASKRVGRWTRNYMFWLGGTRNFWGEYWAGKWYEQEEIKGLYSANLFAEKFNTLLATLTRATVKFKVQASPSREGDTETTGGATVAQRMVEHDARTILDNRFYGLEWSRALLCGFYARYSAWDIKGEGRVYSPVLEDKNIADEGSYYCTNPDCGASGPAKDSVDGTCPHCTTPTALIGSQEITEQIHSGYEEKRTGCPRTFSVDPFEVGLAPEALSIEDSPYVLWQQRIRNSKIKYLYDLKSLKGDKDDLPSGLKGQMALQAALSTGEREQDWKRGTSEFSVMKRYWIEPYMYHDITIQSDTELASGMTLRAGSKLIEFAPDGLYLCRVNDFLDIQPETKEDHWTGDQYYQNIASAYGKGMDDASDLQEVVNELTTIMVEHSRRDAVGYTVVDQDFGIDTTAMRGGFVVPADTQTTGGKKVSDAVGVFNGPQMSASLPATRQQTLNDMTAAVNAYGVMAGSNEQAPETATATSLLVERAVGGLNPMLARWATNVQVTWAEQILRLRRKHMTGDQFIPFVEENEREAGRWFSGSDIDMDFIVSVEEDSWIPRTRLDALAGLEMASSFGQIPGGVFNPAIPEQVRSHVLRLANLPHGLDETLRDRQVAKKRIKGIEEAVKFYLSQNMPPDAERILSAPSIAVLPTDNHAVHIKFIGEYLSDLVDDEMDEPPEELIQTLLGQIDKHKQAMVALKQEQGAMEMLAQAPIQQAQGQQQAEMADAQHAQAQKHAVEDKLLEAAGREAGVVQD